PGTLTVVLKSPDLELYWRLAMQEDWQAGKKVGWRVTFSGGTRFRTERGWRAFDPLGGSRSFYSPLRQPPPRPVLVIAAHGPGGPRLGGGPRRPGWRGRGPPPASPRPPGTGTPPGSGGAGGCPPPPGGPGRPGATRPAGPAAGPPAPRRSWPGSSAVTSCGVR